jgi:signal transduction histidine kinase
VALVILGIAVVFTQLSQTADASRNQLLVGWAEEIAARLTVDAGGVPALRSAEWSTPQQAPHRYSVATADRHIVLAGGAAPPPEPLIIPPPPDAATAIGRLATETAARAMPIVFYAVGAPDRPDSQSRAATLETRVGDSTFFVTVVHDSLEGDARADDPLTAFFGRAGWILIPVMLMVLTAMLATFWAELQLLRDASQLAAQIDPRTTGVRLPEQGLPSEIFPLVHAVNRALDRLEEGFRVQRDFTADAAHELRTPLAVMRAQVDALGDSEVARALRRDIEAMSRLVTQLLRIAQLETLVVDPDERADLHAVAVDVAIELAPLAVQRRRTIHLNSTDAPVIVRANRAGLEHAVRNLVENALSHTPEGTSVEVDVGADGSIAVRDSGPGVPPADRGNLFRRFWRGRQDGGGAGLGLAIVARIVDAHRGSVAYEDAPGGGACFRIRLPIDPATYAA